ncbi:hypothetical protein H8E88_18740 [candidate division KSB1 bacterium]|nr:hypothetical protein [candidate division KSB1 bacterium]MBL7093664.1 hypothetical protein [candidate division KSB1 bacterium]
MKMSKNTLSSILVFFCILTIVFSFNSCSKDFFPRAPEDDLVTDELQKPTGIEEDDSQIISFGDVIPSLKKVVTVNKKINANKGGSLSLEHEIKTRTGKVEVEMMLTIKPNALSKNTKIKMRLDTKKAIFIFNPDGTQFSTPAIFDVKVSGLKLTSSTGRKIDIYYYNEDTGEWEKVKREAVIVDDTRGLIIVKGAQLPHFSRYALSK